MATTLINGLDLSFHDTGGDGSPVMSGALVALSHLSPLPTRIQ